MKESFLEKAARRMDIPSDILAGQVKIEITGMRDLYIQNHQGLLEYGTREIHINCGETVLRLTGEGFVIRAMTARELRIEGLVYTLEFTY